MFLPATLIMILKLNILLILRPQVDKYNSFYNYFNAIKKVFKVSLQGLT